MKIVVIHGIAHKGSTWHLTKMLTGKLPVSDLKEFIMPQDMPHPCTALYRHNPAMYYKIGLVLSSAPMDGLKVHAPGNKVFLLNSL